MMDFPGWMWQRTTKKGVKEIGVTATLTPPKGKGWTLVPGQTPGGNVK